MKRYIILNFSLLFLLINSLNICSKKILNVNDNYVLSFFTTEEIEFIKNNNISTNELKPYLQFTSFNIFNFFEYEKVRKEKNLTIIQTLNTINFPNYYKMYYLPKPATLKNSYLLLVNKAFYLDSSYIPNDLINIKDINVSYIKRENEIMMANKEVLDKYKELENEAKYNNYNFYIFSAYRSYEKQEHIYYDINNCNDKTVARPGFSEHQTGYCLDISTLYYGLSNYFEESNEFKWLINNAHKYGFILRYPKDKENITGYSYESWHFRYVGVEIASFIYKNDLTLEEYIFNYVEIK